MTTLASIKQDICDAYNITMDELVGRHKAPKLVEARKLYVWRAAQETDNSMGRIGQALGGRGHSTVSIVLKRMGQSMSSTYNKP